MMALPIVWLHKAIRLSGGSVMPVATNGVHHLMLGSAETMAASNALRLQRPSTPSTRHSQIARTLK